MPDTHAASSDSMSSTIASQIRLLKSKPATLARQREISRLEKILARARNLEALGETILSAVVPAGGAGAKPRKAGHGKPPTRRRKAARRK